MPRIDDSQDSRDAAREQHQPISAAADVPDRGQQTGRLHLDEEDERLLWSRYIHLSAHWTPSSGLLISKPAPNVRLSYNNMPQQDYPE